MRLPLLLRACAVPALLAGLAGSADAQTRRVVDPDSILAMEVPENWMVADLGSVDASLQMSDPGDRFGLILITEPKADLFGWNMTRFLHVTLGMGVGAVDFPEVSPVEYTTIDGAAAAIATVSGAVAGQQFVYLRTALEAPEHWVQLILVSLRSGWPANEEMLRAVTASVDLLGN